MSDVIETNFLIKSYFSTFKSVEVIFSVKHIVLFLLGVYYFPKTVFLSRCLILSLLEENFRSLIL